MIHTIKRSLARDAYKTSIKQFCRFSLGCQLKIISQKKRTYRSYEVSNNAGRPTIGLAGKQAFSAMNRGTLPT
jgi:hypothetical protein